MKESLRLILRDKYHSYGKNYAAIFNNLHFRYSGNISRKFSKRYAVVAQAVVLDCGFNKKIIFLIVQIFRDYFNLQKAILARFEDIIILYTKHVAQTLIVNVNIRKEDIYVKM